MHSKSRANEISVLEVEAVQLIAGRLCIHHVFIDDEGCAFGVVGDALANLAAQDQYDCRMPRVLCACA